MIYNVPKSAKTELCALLASINRSSILKSRTRLRCVQHGLQRVREVYSGSHTCHLDCGCHRSIATSGSSELLDTEIARLEREIEREEKQREGTLV